MSPEALNKAAQAHLKEYWVIPPKANGGLRRGDGELLEAYTRAHDRPLMCLDEIRKQRVSGETLTPLPM
jgi:hypothetical protein